ncbi:hypothetical protein [Aeromonas jandaei]|uniref:hypothetical protein n=1 Tax=Aeromonas jandaei TaxID=650 RepID=UPI0036720D6F
MLHSFKEFQIIKTVLTSAHAGEYKTREEMAEAAYELGINKSSFETVLTDYLKAGAKKL